VWKGRQVKREEIRVKEKGGLDEKKCADFRRKKSESR